jgi:hypothetical protein
MPSTSFNDYVYEVLVMYAPFADNDHMRLQMDAISFQTDSFKYEKPAWNRYHGFVANAQTVYCCISLARNGTVLEDWTRPGDD